MKKIIVTLSLEPQHRSFFESQISGAAEETELIWSSPEELTQEMIASANAVIGPAEPDVLRGSQALEWLQISWAGADNYLRPGILRDDTVLTNASGAYGLAVSEHMIAFTFALIRRLNQYARRQQEHTWSPMGDIISVEGARVLVLGLGDIGGRYAKKMKALGAYVIGLRRTNAPKPEYADEVYTIDRLDEVLPKADIVAMALPGGDATDHIMDERRLRLMKRGAYLVNCGRGSAVDPEGLRNVLSEGHIGGAAIDVTEPEPLPSDDPLWDDERVIITPHVSGQFYLRETYELVVRICGENLYRYVRGLPLEHIVDRHAGY